MRIALEATGSLGPDTFVAGALQALRANKDIRITLVGSPGRLEPLLQAATKLRSRVEVFPSSQLISADEEPLQALRIKPDSSVARCWQLLAERKVDAIVMTGPVRAVVAGGLRLQPLLPRVRRPGVAASLPGAARPITLIDVSGDSTAAPPNLYQYAVMASVWASRILGCTAPKIGLLEPRAADGVPSDCLKEAQTLIRESPLRTHYMGMIAAGAVFNEDVDVLVCDGGTGSALLQTSDAVLAFLRRADAEAARRTGGEGAWTDILAQAEPPAGFPLLGIEGTCILAHHARSEQTIANAVHLAATAMTQQVNHGIVQETEHGPLD